MSAPGTPSLPHQPQLPDELERDVARTADLVLKLAALAERYEAGAGSADRVASMREAVRRGRRQLAALAGTEASPRYAGCSGTGGPGSSLA